MKVFLSSTAQDLIAYRQVANDTILRLSQQAVSMARFGPLPGTPSRSANGWRARALSSSASGTSLLESALTRTGVECLM
jgi:hypothetical protein